MILKLQHVPEDTAEPVVTEAMNMLDDTGPAAERGSQRVAARVLWPARGEERSAAGLARLAYALKSSCVYVVAMQAALGDVLQLSSCAKESEVHVFALLRDMLEVRATREERFLGTN